MKADVARVPQHEPHPCCGSRQDLIIVSDVAWPIAEPSTVTNSRGYASQHSRGNVTLSVHRIAGIGLLRHSVNAPWLGSWRTRRWAAGSSWHVKEAAVTPLSQVARLRNCWPMISRYPGAERCVR